MSVQIKVMLLLICLISSCSAVDDEDYNVIFLEESAEPAGDFDDYFYKKREIELSFDDKREAMIIPAIYSIEVNSRGQIVIPDYSNQTLVLYDRSGKGVKVIGEGEGRGPGEFERISAFKFLENDEFWVYDAGLMRVSVFSPPEYELDHTLNMEMYLSDFLVNKNQEIIVFTYHQEKDLLIKKDEHGEIAESAIEEKDKPLKIFLGRFQGGGITSGFKEETFMAVYPGEFGVFEIGMDDLKIKSKIVSRNSDISDFRPNIPPFPSRLDPYDYTDAHASWWYSFFHISKLFTVEPNLIILTLYEQTGSRDYAFYVNVYDTEGGVIVEGLPIPEETRVVGTWKNKIFFARDEQIMPDGTILPAKLASYEIKNNRP